MSDEDAPAEGVTPEPAPRPRLREVIHLLERAMGDRPFVLIYDLAHPNGDVSHLRVHEPRAQPVYVTLGLLTTGEAVVKSEVRPKAPPPGEGASDD